MSSIPIGVKMKNSKSDFRCNYCGKRDPLWHRCKFCGKIFCSEHLLPEGHNCEMLPQKIAHKETHETPQAAVEPVKKDKSPAEKGRLDKAIRFVSGTLKKGLKDENANEMEKIGDGHNAKEIPEVFEKTSKTSENAPNAADKEGDGAVKNPVLPIGMKKVFSPQREKVAPKRWQIGDKIQNRYEIHDIKMGGMGIVYICYDHEFREPVVLKTFQDEYLRNRASVDRFKLEAETWIKLEKHHNIVIARYFKEIEGRPYIFLEPVVGNKQYGADLNGWIRGRGLTLPLALIFAIQFCHGMVHAQKKFQGMRKPFVHRDIKPQNIMVTQDKVVKVTDFGLVKAFTELSEDITPDVIGDESHQRFSFSKSGNICGTPPYMSPEQCQGLDVDVSSDIYAFGCVLYEMVTGRYIFDARMLEEFIYHHLRTMPKSPNVHKQLDKVIMKCLEKNPSQRYHDFEELEKALSNIYFNLTGEEVKPPKDQELEASDLNNKGVSLANLGLYEEAIICYAEALRINPNDASAHNNLGIAYQSLGKLDLAIEAHKEALKINPNSAQAHGNLGIAYQREGEHDLAIEELKEVLRITPYDTKAHGNLGAAYLSQGKLDLAVKEFKEALRLKPNSFRVHCNLGIAYNGQEEFELAINEYKQALGINPNSAEVHYNLGNIYKNQGKGDLCFQAIRGHLGLPQQGPERLNSAIREYEEAIRINPNFAIAYYGLGDAYLSQFRSQEAIKCFQRFIELAPPQYASQVKHAEEIIRKFKQMI